MGKVLGLDVGSVRIGVALTDDDQTTSLAEAIVAAEPRDAALDGIAAIIEREHVDQIVCGLPLKLDGTEGEQAKATRAFAEKLRTRVPLPVEFIDERFSTSQSRDAAALKGHTHPDAEAARLILQTWLDRRRVR